MLFRRFNMKTTVVIPVFNEELSIGSLVLKTKKYVDQVIVIDDGSVDKTAEVAKLAGAKIISNYERKGKGEALKKGFFAAAQDGTNIIVTIGAEGQYNLDEIPKIIKPIIDKKADLVIGRRNGDCRIRNNNLNKKIKITDRECGFRAFGICTVSAFKFKQNGSTIENEMLTEAIEAGFRIEKIFINKHLDTDQPFDQIAKGRKVIAIGAHPDDIEIGVAMRLMYHVSHGEEVVGIICTDGEMGGDRVRRLNEAEKSAKFIGIKKLYHLQYPDTYLYNYFVPLKNDLEKIIHEEDPWCVYVLCQNDRHQDHKTVSDAAAIACRNVKNILQYRTPSTIETSFIPSIFHYGNKNDFKKKIDALKYHKSQIESGRISLDKIKLESSYFGTRGGGFPGSLYAEPFQAVHFNLNSIDMNDSLNLNKIKIERNGVTIKKKLTINEPLTKSIKP